MLGQDEVGSVVLHIDDVDDLAIAAVLNSIWRAEAIRRLSALRGLRPADGLNVIGRGTLKLREATFLAVLPSGDLAVAESSLHRVSLFSPDGQRQRTLGTFGYAPRMAAAASASIPLHLNYPKGIACDASGTHLFVADRSNHRVLKCTLSDGTVLATMGGPGMGPQRGRFKYPQGLAVAVTAAHGELVFVSDYGNDRICALDAITLEWRHSLLHVDQLALPVGLAMSTDGRGHASELYVVDASHHEVHVIALDAEGHATAGDHAAVTRTLGRHGIERGELDFRKSPPSGAHLQPDGHLRLPLDCHLH